MNFIFGIIILALFILALRVLWATTLQLLIVLKQSTLAFQRYRAQRKLSVRNRLPVIMPHGRENVDWLAISDSVRQEIQSRNRETNRELERLDVELQVKTKTMELIKADIQIAKLQLELEKVRPTVVLDESKAGKRTKRSKQTASEMDGDVTKSSHPVHQLRTAFKPSTMPIISANELARH
ncbi:MAG: hypothetical protein PHR94_13315 [Methylomonas lenta]|nr:hypothetical protein [Methylomonas lenta]